MTELQQHPAYHAGFYDAQDGEPIWLAECAPEYAAGWTAYWELRAAMSPQVSVGEPK